MCLQRNVVLDEENRFGEYLTLSADKGGEPKIIVPERGPDPERVSPKVPDMSVVYGPGTLGKDVPYGLIKK
jgi:hypothetical protein